MSEFKAGNVVALKSGGPNMTVEALTSGTIDEQTIPSAICVWMNFTADEGYKSEREAFSLTALTLAQVIIDEDETGT